jgi:antitoxin (DNA-binding transcriptional repressor) of toxin-antitoxin stability system
MGANTATIRQLRTDFRSVKRRIEEHGEVIITDHGEPAYLLKSLPPPSTSKRAAIPDYYRRLLKRQPKPLSAEQTRLFWEEERG